MNSRRSKNDLGGDPMAPHPDGEGKAKFERGGRDGDVDDGWWDT